MINIKRQNIFYKQKTLKFLLYWYIGGLSYFVGTSLSNLPFIFICSFILTEFAGNRLYMTTISNQSLRYVLTNRYLNLLLNFFSNFVITFTVVFTNQYLYENEILKFVIEPFTFGLIYSVIYSAYLKMATKH
ncbi:hypothetical protein [Vallitalea okinawensis]|uniref:hypothetical protein n=1 Tax=Vallitalea okinawensis TaxID=2078660 RepID=UPI000CFC9A49|nr:hypothetical protein [Vallitalea okinawensis]